MRLQPYVAWPRLKFPLLHAHAPLPASVAHLHTRTVAAHRIEAHIEGALVRRPRLSSPSSSAACADVPNRV
jgi:hypothetical protein